MHLVNRKRIDFILGGAQKCGTSAVDRYLRDHPRIRMARRKEVHYFDKEKWSRRLDLGYRMYHRWFDWGEENLVRGEATPVYLYWKHCAKRIRQYFPDIKLIFILRCPVERAYAHWNMEYNRGREGRDFSTCIRAEVRGSQDRIASYVDRGFYTEQLDRYFQRFDRTRIHIIKYEDLRAAQEKTLKGIFDFLKVGDHGYDFLFYEVRKTAYHGEMSGADREYLNNIFREDVRQLQDLLDWDCGDWLRPAL